MEISRVSDTRWSCQAKQFNALWNRMEIVCEVLNEVIDNDSNSSRVTEATGYLLQIDRRFLRYLSVLRHVLTKAKFASDMLQNPSNDLTHAVDLIGTLKEEIIDCRTRKSCQEFWEAAETIADKLCLPETSRPKRKVAPPAVLSAYHVESNIQQHTTDGFDVFVQNVFEVIDKIDGELNRRFSDKNLTIMKGISSLCPTSKTFLEPGPLTDFSRLFKANTDILNSKLITFKHLLDRKSLEQRPGSLLQLHTYLEELKEVFFELERISLVACALPVSSAECERNFSSMRLIKNDLRSDEDIEEEKEKEEEEGTEEEADEEETEEEAEEEETEEL
ncbi:uncharacterized protein LOC117119979 [Anneissia japonica]|uniref:uncharacterized protein LOC117119979 n=1 Tax=Anneissia japonica TaxID=1529436 RepID=UPI00142556C1|nr:uncharacterized protein LOC117119979 [Anneissia japonica]